MTNVPLTQGKFAIVDSTDFPALMKFRWVAAWSGKKKWYALRCLPNGTIQKMEHFILKPKNGVIVDHKNLNGLDNRRINLRLATYSQNAANINKYKRKYGRCSSSFKGVHWDKNIKAWRSRICVNGKRIDLGSFKNEVDAAKAYDASSVKNFREFARPNLG